MSTDIYVVLVCEDELSETVLRRLLAHSNRPFVVSHCIPPRGFGGIKRDIYKYVTACKAVPHIVLTDLDQSPCPPALLESWGIAHSRQPKELLFSIAVREVESWLLADANGLSAFLGVPTNRMPVNPEAERDPKRTLINIARRSRYRRMMSEIVPSPGSISSQGVLYNYHLCRFVKNDWDVGAASGNSLSLLRIIARLNDFMA